MTPQKRWSGLITGTFGVVDRASGTPWQKNSAHATIFYLVMNQALR